MPLNTSETVEDSTLSVLLGPSRRLAGLFAGAHLAAAAVAWLSLSKWWLSCAVSTVIAASLADCLRVYALRTSRRAATRVTVEADGSVSVAFRQTPAAVGRLLGSSFVSSMLIILRVRTHGRWAALPILIAPDSLEPEEFRRLLVWLRWRPLRAGTDTAKQVDARDG